jgi:DNA repair photolyase
VKLEYQEYRARKIVNVQKHVDGGWFWTKYSAHPYIGCRSGCEFCYLRGGRYLGSRSTDSFDRLIQVKMNAPVLLKKELSRMPVDVINAGDWQQPAESRYALSREMLKVVLDLNFPLFIVERSALLARDIDLLVEINACAWVAVAYSLSNLDPQLKRAFEPRSPGVKQRLNAMQKLARAGILTGTALMPIIPFHGDDPRHLEQAIVATRDHGGSFVLAGGMTMSGVQADRTLASALNHDPSAEPLWRQMYQWNHESGPSSSPPRGYAAKLGRVVRELCAKHGMDYRIPRYIPPGELAVNRFIAEKLFLKTYELELAEADERRIWAYRRAAWTVDESEVSLQSLHREAGRSGLEKLPGIGTRLSGAIASWLLDWDHHRLKAIKDFTTS